MGKKTENTQEQVEKTAPAFVEELMKKGSAILRAKTREELAEMVNEIPADVKYGAGAVGQSREDGTFVLMVELVK
ncbi:MAG: hypothetical protein J6T37_01540 [Bacteroidales bacterium]|nr:hypothetical protein [Bacteroidaceae bacterium]MBO5707666.1 hypothetical protein [Bacteroidaceae bacterium]MBO7528279.1 hypothetical protein [Bacteroidales bacterium]MBO7528540.1 hypothetical protein [Bacteroidales bacterium]